MPDFFLDSSETFFFFFAFYPFFSKILGSSFHLGALSNCLIGLVEGQALHILLVVALFDCEDGKMKK